MTLNKILLLTSLVTLYILLIVPFMALAKSSKKGDEVLREISNDDNKEEKEL